MIIELLINNENFVFLIDQNLSGKKKRRRNQWIGKTLIIPIELIVITSNENYK